MSVCNVPLIQARKFECDSREEWLAVRKCGIGASESACLFGAGYASQSPISLYQEKLSKKVTEIDPALAKRMRIGKQMEPALRAIFQDETGMAVEDPGEFTVWQHATIDWLFATLDGLVWNSEFDQWCVTELKNISFFNRDEWEGEPPLKYAIQVQHQLAVTGLETGYLLGLIGGQDPVIKEIKRNDDFIENGLIPVTRDFWNCVQNETLPDVDASEATKKALVRLYPEDDGEEILLPPEFDAIDAELVEVKDSIKHLEERQLLLENKIKANLGNATSGVLRAGGRYSWKVQEKKSYVVKASSTRVLRRHK